jgi:polyhydroxybutyrate depolymerase
MTRREERASRALVVLAAVVVGAATACGGPGGSNLKPLSAVPDPCRTPRPAGDYRRDVTVHGDRRRYLLHVPRAAAGVRLPLVLSLHGGGADAALQIRRTQMNAVADTRGVAVAYPEGTTGVLGLRRTWNAGSCCGRAPRRHVDDVAFAAALIDDVNRAVCIDSGRVYATGMSNGAMMAYRLACELSTRIAAIAPVAGTLVLSDCKPLRPVSVLAFNGTSDRVVRYGGGHFGERPVADTIRLFRRLDGCPARPQVRRSGDATFFNWAPCRDRTRVVLVRITGGGHTWPGGNSPRILGKTSRDVSASESMLRFFLSLPRRPA